MSLRILHANSNILMQNGLKTLAERGGGIDELKVCVDEECLLALLKEGLWDLLVIDYQAGGFDSVSTITRIRQAFPAQKMLVISGVIDNTQVLQVLEQGTEGFLTYECDEAEIVHSIFAIAKGEKFFCNKVLDIILNKHLYNTAEDNCSPTSLSERENEITALIAQGKTSKEIAEQLFLSPHTVHTHRKNIMKKLGVKSASELTLYAINVGLIQT